MKTYFQNIGRAIGVIFLCFFVIQLAKQGILTQNVRINAWLIILGHAIKNGVFVSMLVYSIGLLIQKLFRRH